MALRPQTKSIAASKRHDKKPLPSPLTLFRFPSGATLNYKRAMNSKLIVMDRPISQVLGLPFGALLSALTLALMGTGCGPAAPKSSGDAASNPAAEAKSPAAASKAAVEPFGTYALVSVDGKKVPCTVTHEGQAMTIQSGSFIVNRDGTCLSKIALGGEDSTPEVKATFKQEGATLTMQWEGAGTTTGTLDGNTFKMTNEGMALVYRK